jgi:transposase-like protein
VVVSRNNWRQVDLGGSDRQAVQDRETAGVDQAEEDVLADYPATHRAKLHSINPIERLNGKIKRRTNVVGIFPNDEAIVRSVGQFCSNRMKNVLISAGVT